MPYHIRRPHQEKYVQSSKAYRLHSAIGLRLAVVWRRAKLRRITESVDNDRERGRGLPPARKEDVKPWKGRTPLLKNRPKAAAAYLRASQVLRDIRKSEPGFGGLKNRGNAVESPWAIDTYPKIALTLLQFPRINTTLPREAHVDTRVVGKVRRRSRRRMLLQIRGSGDNNHRDIGRNPNGLHIFGNLVAKTNSGVISLRDDVDESCVDRYIEFDIGYLG
jgi:hypothetical protein